MNPHIICETMKADLLERTRRSSFLLLCAFSLFLAFFSVPNVDAPLVSICMEPSIFSQGSNPSWIPITIALCGGILFPMIGLSFVKNNISMDRESGFLYSMQSMNMKKGNYAAGKFLSNLLVLTVMWIFVITGAAFMLPFQFPHQPLPIYDFFSPFIGIYPGIIFTSALAVLLESLPFINRKAGNTVGLTILFVTFLINYSTSEQYIPLLRIFDYSNYGWIMDSINLAVTQIIGHKVRETGILVPGGIFAGSNGGQELFFHGLIWDSQYLLDKFSLVAISIAVISLAAISLETTERRKSVFYDEERKNKRLRQKKIYYTHQFISEYKMLLRCLPKSCLIIDIGLWICCIFAPLKYVQTYLWIIMLIFSVTLFSQMGCREYENHLSEYFVTIKFSLPRQMLYSYFGGTISLLALSVPIIIRTFAEQGLLHSCCYILFSFFVPAVACFLGEYSKSRRTFETVYLLLCFLLLNMPSFLFQESVIRMMALGSIILIPVSLIKRLYL